MWLILSVCAFVLLCFISYDKKDYTVLLTDRSKQHLIFGLMAALTFLWSIQTGIYEGLSVYFLGITLTSLLLGSHLALICTFCAYLLSSLYVGDSLYNIALGLFPKVGLPVFASYLVYAWAYHHLPRHFIIYTFVCGFFTGALSIASMMLGNALFLWLDNQFSWPILLDNYIILTPLMLFPEAMLNGMCITIAVVYLPNWVRTFYDSEYLDK
ncbi:hypothetical protein C2869_15430 [Saccharobesus litoralis]|uniref:Uncharacterized protein n=1 Tax=Saccharobesus litoralis TaxID=2172099 RepID=A0A2S0VU60_9ALTE|nr:energy-coupling factor ABC transporter permease [Saccharobesus litoralis]AWB67745.1 hypothetical protein C2869_15430 [Saccharobesus litoralis]